MTRPVIICIDDQRDVLASLMHDLEDFAEEAELVDCESAEEAAEVLEESDSRCVPVALIISDHVMPKKTGVEFLSEVEADGRFAETKKLLLTGLATHKDTIEAINRARIDLYIAKPWKRGEVRSAVKRLFTHFLFDADLDYREFSLLADANIVFERLK